MMMLIIILHSDFLTIIRRFSTGCSTLATVLQKVNLWRQEVLRSSRVKPVSANGHL